MRTDLVEAPQAPVQGIRSVVNVQFVLDSIHDKASFCYPISHAAHGSS